MLERGEGDGSEGAFKKWVVARVDGLFKELCGRLTDKSPKVQVGA